MTGFLGYFLEGRLFWPQSENIFVFCISSVWMFSVHKVYRLFDKLHECLYLFMFVPQGLTIPVASSMREGSVSVDWGLRAESLLLLTNKGVSTERTRTWTVIQCWQVTMSISKWDLKLKINGKVMMSTGDILLKQMHIYNWIWPIHPTAFEHSMQPYK